MRSQARPLDAISICLVVIYCYYNGGITVFWNYQIYSKVFIISLVTGEFI